MLIKRFFDFFGSIIIIIILLPVLTTLAILLRKYLGSPIVFRQKRPGLNGKIFTFYKFRTMINEKGKNGKLLEDKDRITKFGLFLRKTSLDEFPSLWNVLRGDMSFVGPRPLLMEYLDHYNSEQARRHDVKPGITGWAQINGRNAICWEDKFKLDIWYVDNRTIRLDIKILFLTIWKVLTAEGINQVGHVTVEKFKGY